MIRLFAALSLPPDIIDRLTSLQAGLAGWRLSAPENFHVTLAFFGEVDQRKAEDIDAALRDVQTPPFDLWLDGVDVFGAPRPRLAYAAVRPGENLALLRNKTRHAGRSAGADLPAERYVPHVTLARGGARADKRLAGWLTAGGAFLAGPIRCEDFVLYRSDLGRAGPAYVELARYKLAGE